MPTPHGPRGGMAFSADELRVLRRALAEVLRPTPTSTSAPRWAGEVQEYLRLAEALDEAAREGGRLRMFLLAELSRYRAALPGAAGGYLERLGGALDTGYVPAPDDLAALRGLHRRPCSDAERRRVARLLRHCEHLAELDVRARLEGRKTPPPRRPGIFAEAQVRTRLMALPGGLVPPMPRARGAAGADEPSPARVPTPGEVWPARRPGLPGSDPEPPEPPAERSA